MRALPVENIDFYIKSNNNGNLEKLNREKTIMAFKPYDLQTKQAINKLKRLKPKLDSKIPASRIEFATTVFKFDLYDEIRSYDLYDDFGLSDRDLDTCFEMNDGDIVVHGIMKTAIANPIMEGCIRATGSSVWDSWLKTYKTHETQVDMLT